MTDHFDILLKSFKAVMKNKVTLVLWLIISIALLAVVLAAAIPTIIVIVMAASLRSEAMFIFGAILAVLATIVIVTAFCYYTAAFYGMIADMSILGKSSLNRIFSHGKKHFFNIVSYIGAQLFVIIGIVVLLAVPALLIFLLPFWWAKLAWGIFLVLLLVTAILIFWVFTLFGLPIVIIKKKGGFGALREAVSFSRKNPGHAFLTAITIFVIGFISSVIQFILELPGEVAKLLLDFNEFTLPLFLFLIAVSFLFGTISAIVGLVSHVATSIYTFKSYLSKNPVKIKTKKNSF